MTHIRRFDVDCRITVQHTDESLEAHVELEGDVVSVVGDKVLVHGAPVSVPYGGSLDIRRRATVTRATFLERQVVRLRAMFELTELYEVSFSGGRL
ncbi:MAG: hypothetical protein AAFR11_07780 [Pseudomonadota bacterium]